MKENRGKSWILNYCPDLLNLYDPTLKEWERINKKIERRFSFLSNQEEGKFEFESNLFDQILRIVDESLSSRERAYSRCFIGFINETCQSLYKFIPQNSHKSLKAPILNLLENFDNTKSRYLNHVGEIAALDSFLSSQVFTFISLEQLTPHGTSSDFYFHGNDGKDYVLEVMNKQFDVEKWSKIEDLETFFGKEISRKIQKKKYTPDGFGNSYFSFVVNLWGHKDFSQIIQFREFFDFKNYGTYEGFPIIFCGLINYEISEESFVFSYAPIDSLIEIHRKNDTTQLL